MIVENVRLSQQAKEQLVKLKRHTGITQWNILCRWALCLSLKEKKVPQDKEITLDSSVEMSWKTFGGRHQDVYSAAIVQRCKKDGIALNDKNLQKYFKLHLHRGIGYLSTSNMIRSVEDLVRINVRNDDAS